MSNFEWLDALGLDRTKLPQLSEQMPEVLGQPKPTKDAMSQLPQRVPTERGDARAENDIPSSREGVGREANSATERDRQTAWAEGFINCWQLLFQSGLLVYPAQQEGKDCRGCKHIIMTTEHHDGRRRKFFWRCGLDHQQLEMGLHGERVIIAPPDCEDYESPEEKRWG